MRLDRLVYFEGPISRTALKVINHVSKKKSIENATRSKFRKLEDKKIAIHCVGNIFSIKKNKKPLLPRAGEAEVGTSFWETGW